MSTQRCPCPVGSGSETGRGAWAVSRDLGVIIKTKAVRGNDTSQEKIFQGRKQSLRPHLECHRHSRDRLRDRSSLAKVREKAAGESGGKP